MFRVLIWDYTGGTSQRWIEQVIDANSVKIVGTITPSEQTPEILLKEDAWDWLLIFEKDMRNFFEVTIEILNLPLAKVIYALDISSWMMHSKAAFALISPNRAIGDEIHLNLNFEINRQLNDLATCTVDGLSYVAKSNDLIMRNMYIERVNWISDELMRFYELSKQYYDIDDSSGYFLDLQANIGTSGIYFLKNFATDLNLLAFESDAENFKLLRANLILNDLESKTTAVNCILSDRSEKKTNYGKIIKLDDYLAENKIAPEEVKYIWLDTKNLESQILLGAKNLLRKNPVPIFMECDLGVSNKSDIFEKMLALLAEQYSYFVFFENGEENLYPLEVLRTRELLDKFGERRGDIFLIKKDTFN